MTIRENSCIKQALISGFAVTAFLSGCATSTQITTQNGKPGHVIDCAGGSMSHCYQKASQLCGTKGYTVLDQNNRPAGLFTSADMRLVIECKQGN